MSAVTAFDEKSSGAPWTWGAKAKLGCVPGGTSAAVDCNNLIPDE
jgi:hypothetical protein